MTKLYTLHFEGAIWVSTKPFNVSDKTPGCRIITQAAGSSKWSVSCFSKDYQHSGDYFKFEEEAFLWLQGVDL